MEAFVGTILPWLLSWAPDGWLLCQGQQLPITQYQALYSLLGATYGGDQRTYFNLPDLRGRMPIGVSSNKILGGKAGSETVSIPIASLPAHNHPGSLTNTSATGSVAISVPLPPLASDDATLAEQATPAATTCLGIIRDNSGSGAEPVGYATLTTGKKANISLKTDPICVSGPVSISNISGTVAIGNTGTNQPVNTMPPYLVMNYIICNVGLYPVRS